MRNPYCMPSWKHLEPKVVPIGLPQNQWCFLAVTAHLTDDILIATKINKVRREFFRHPPQRQCCPRMPQPTWHRDPRLRCPCLWIEDNLKVFTDFSDFNKQVHFNCESLCRMRCSYYCLPNKSISKRISHIRSKLYRFSSFRGGHSRTVRGADLARVRFTQEDEMMICHLNVYIQYLAYQQILYCISLFFLFVNTQVEDVDTHSLVLTCFTPTRYSFGELTAVPDTKSFTWEEICGGCWHSLLTFTMVTQNYTEFSIIEWFNKLNEL